MIKKYVTGLLAATALAGTAWATSATDASEIVTSVSSDIETYLSDNTLDQAEANELLDYIAVEEVGKFALGRAGRDASAEDMAAFQASFKNYLGEQLQIHLGELSGATFEVLDTVERATDDVIVETKVSGAGADVDQVNWRLQLIGGDWKVVDVEAMGLWLAIEQRAQFDAKLDANGGDIKSLAAEL